MNFFLHPKKRSLLSMNKFFHLPTTECQAFCILYTYTTDDFLNIIHTFFFRYFRSLTYASHKYKEGTI